MSLEHATLWVSMIAVVFAAATVFVAACGIDQAAQQSVEDRRSADDRAAADRVSAEASADAHRAALRVLAEEEARPYVVASMEFNAAHNSIIDLVIRNYGQTAAYNVELTSEPPLTRSPGGPANLVGPKIRTLAPGQTWFAFWDSAISRYETDLPDEHAVRIAYSDPHGREHTTQSFLDWTVHKGMLHPDVYGLHDLAKAVREINKRDEEEHRRQARERAWAQRQAEDVARGDEGSGDSPVS